ncbi:MAG: tRNA preQ1(34) S-adenosylmethionine ribosyltransferase-isomerase QueA [Candidatus Lloydbacteria bacterium RIFCSPHIGHO2_01_FULL_49_22]|uniref:S-adenosylmethionine:tRNA ribosyltransferase-isomerase n=1 Tax=Candidatus Lloydbacteria bacterium RIFCSPHIGHO2_01_FULL_49_22 TaxID=1798658 RepID=A0A1G2CYB3_9BACT|nr:MAG: tRNA preQ1(34) S-adenosylmethionine ribosyltransferase-isomerase QueA [Candidatus Lloydbacteria bacterium RIFCSPHIGHO2_01_FULL_49_22]OGZ09424.1 MAG: tRNA preQ1(34) S-adenosylmethionine ribosyltransferase-isomerase QueA [Candidatus Lloydbacteria bacterium RIFCSPHIGHO2_02_FULL_50_18]
MISLDDYNYHLPEGLIANEPASPRDSARLFVYDTKTDKVHFDVFRNIDQYLPKPSLLVFNDTKVVPARLWLSKETGGKIEVLLMMNEFRPGDISIKGVVDRKILPGAKLFFKSGAHLEVERQEEQFFFFNPSVSKGSLWSLLEKEGVTPIPPYIKGNTMSEHTLREKYQSILAKYPASIAAPTASLHFTDRLLEKMKREHITRTEVTLHVGAGTFAPIDEQNFKSKKLFAEYLDITKESAKKINSAKAAGIPIIPVGTTAMRTLESAAIQHSKVEPWSVEQCSKPTNIFIYPPYEFKIADGLITNFHVPRSSLMLLVDALLKHKRAKRDILALYDIAIREKFRFYSFGDGMLII